MIKLKKKSEIEILKRAGKILTRALRKAISLAKPDIETERIDQKAKEVVKKQGAEPAFSKLKGYRWTTCLSVNEEIVHTPPSKRKLKNGDILTIDIGVNLEGLNVDSATSLIVGSEEAELKRFLNMGSKTLKKAISKAVPGNHIGDISKTIEKGIVGEGYFIIKELTGHGIGKKLHEDPLIPGFLDRRVAETPPVENGMVLAIEVIYSMGTDKIVYDKNGWSIKTEDGSLSACFEKTIAVWGNKALNLT